MSNKNTDWEGVGCIVLLTLLALPFILQSIFEAIIPYIFVGLLGLGLYRLYVYDTKTRNITNWLEDGFNLPKTHRNYLQDTAKELKHLDSKIDTLHAENETLKLTRKKEIHETIRQYSHEIGQHKKKELLNNVFGENASPNYARSDEFERQQHQEQTRKKEDELNNRIFKQDVREQIHEQDNKILQQDKKILEVADEAKQDRFLIRSEVREGFIQVDKKFQYMGDQITRLEGEFNSFKGYVAQKFSHLEVTFLKEINVVKELVQRLRVDVKEEFANVKLSFGKEILRMDKQQLGIIDRLGKYENQVRAYSFEMMRYKNEAERFAIRGEDMLNRSNTIHQRHKVVLSQSSNELNIGLQQMALHKMSFANTVGEAKLRLDQISQDQHFALKDMAYERIGINMLRQEYDQRVTLEKEKMQNLLLQQKHLEEKMRTAQSKGEQVEGLKHQLHITKENLAYTTHRANLMRQENSMVRKLSRN